MAMLQGPIYWAKILGKPQPGYDKRQLEWSFDVGIDKKTRKNLEELEVGDYIKPAEKNGRTHASGTEYMKFSRKELKFDGSPGQPIKVVDRTGQPWPEDRKIGNGSIVNVKFAVNEKQSGGMKPSVVALQVWEYVPYEGGDDFPVSAEGAEEW